MAAIATRAPAGHGSFSRLIATFFDRWSNRSNEARTLMELNRLTDRELEDIGISRFDIRAIAKGEYRR